MSETVIQGSPIDPVEEFRSWPPPQFETLGEFDDIIYEVGEGIARITINRPERRNAFRPQTLFELSDAFERARDDIAVGVIILRGAGPDAFCSGGTRRSAVTTATLATTTWPVKGSDVSTCWTSRSRFVVCPNR